MQLVAGKQVTVSLLTKNKSGSVWNVLMFIGPFY